jgi:hypothetical protein
MLNCEALRASVVATDPFPFFGRPTFFEYPAASCQDAGPG